MKPLWTHLLLLAVAAGLAVGWFAERTSSKPFDIAGHWRAQGGYMGYDTSNFVSVLQINDDGTYTKTESTGENGSSFSGTWNIDEEGLVNFHVLKRARVWGEKTDPAEDVQLYFQCRCGLDSSGVLVIDMVNNFSSQPVSVNWNASFHKQRPG